MVQQLLFPVPHLPGLFGALFVVESEHVDKAVNDEPEEPFVEGHARRFGFHRRLLHGNNHVPERLMGKSVKVGKGNDVGGPIFAEAFLVEPGNADVVGEKNAEGSILQPRIDE